MKSFQETNPITPDFSLSDWLLHKHCLGPCSWKRFSYFTAVQLFRTKDLCYSSSPAGDDYNSYISTSKLLTVKLSHQQKLSPLPAVLAMARWCSFEGSDGYTELGWYLGMKWEKTLGWYTIQTLSIFLLSLYYGEGKKRGKERKKEGWR